MDNKLQWPGFNDKGSVIIALGPETFCFKNEKFVLDDISYTAKDELHVTLIGSSLGSVLQDRIKHDQALINVLLEIFEAIDWSFKQTGPVHVLSREKDNIIQRSIIMLIEMCGVGEFYEQLRIAGMIGPETPVPPPHITLYTYNCPTGIGVPDFEELDTMSVKTLMPDEFSLLLNSNQSV